MTNGVETSHEMQTQTHIHTHILRAKLYDLHYNGSGMITVKCRRNVLYLTKSPPSVNDNLESQKTRYNPTNL